MKEAIILGIAVIIFIIIIVYAIAQCGENFIDTFSNEISHGFIGNKPPLDKDLYILYSMSNSPYQEWQGDLLDFSFQHVNQPGTLIRIVTDDTKYPNRKVPESKVGYTFYTPNYSKLNDKTDWPVMNKPGSMKYLMDHVNFKPGAILLFFDPDMIFTKKWIPKVQKGTVYTQRWKGYSQDYCKQTSIEPELCPDKEEECTMFPFAITASDMKTIAPTLETFARNGYLKKAQWMADMSAFVTSMAKHKLKVITVPNIALCNDWDNHNDPDAPILHYCQAARDKNKKEIWGKRRYKAWDTVPDPSTATNRVDREVLTMIHKYRNQNL